MGKKSAPAAPPAPDYAGAARETAAANLEMAKYQTEANRINQVNPYGTLSYSQDANGKWTQTETLDPRIQNTLNSQIGVQQGLSDQANSMLGAVRNSYNQPFDAPEWQSYLSGVGNVDTRSLGTAGQFGSGAQVQNGINMNGVTAVDQSGQPAMGRFMAGPGTRVDTNVNDNLAGTNGVNQSFNSSGSNVSVDPSMYMGGTQGLNQNFGRFGDSGAGVNTSAPQFDNARQDQYSKAAYEAQMGLLRSDLAAQEERQNNRLALQGLNVGSEANDSAMASFYDGRSRQLNALANQSVLTGNQMLNNDYQSQLAGFNAGNAAVGQQFSQNLAGFNANQNALTNENAARGQSFSQGLAAFNARNDAAGQKFNQDLGAFNASNAAQNQSFGQALQAYQAQNAARGQQFDQNSNAFTQNMAAASLNNQLQQSRNDAQNQAFNQALASGQFNNAAAAQQFSQDQATYDNQLRALTTNAALQQAYNQAQQQAYAQAAQNYGTEWQQESTLRNMSLNELNALLSGQQVQNPQFQNYALQQYTGGADLLGAAQLQGQYNSGVYAAQNANRSAGKGAMGNLAGSGMMAAATYFSDERLKKNVEKVGETPYGTNIYTWDWNKKAKKIGADEGPTTGVLAQENLHAAVPGPGGFLKIDYSKIH